MAKKQGGGKLLPLPFTTLGELVAHWLEAKVYCSCCYEHCPRRASHTLRGSTWEIPFSLVELGEGYALPIALHGFVRQRTDHLSHVTHRAVDVL